MTTDEDEGRLRSLYEIFAIRAEDAAAEPRPQEAETAEALQLARLFFDQDAEVRAGLLRLARLYVTLDQAARDELNAAARKLASRRP